MYIMYIEKSRCPYDYVGSLRSPIIMYTYVYMYCVVLSYTAYSATALIRLYAYSCVILPSGPNAFSAV